MFRVKSEDEEAPVSASSLVMMKFTSAVTVVADEGTVTVFANRVLVQVPSLPGRQLSHILLALAQAQRPQVPVLLHRQQTIADQVPLSHRDVIFVSRFSGSSVVRVAYRDTADPGSNP